MPVVKLKIQLLNYTSNPEVLVGIAGKLCYSPEGFEEVTRITQQEANEFTERLISFHHESPIEHIYFNFSIEGVSRSLLSQLSRHRLISLSVRSQRYIRENGFSFIIPKGIQNNQRAKMRFLEAMREDQLAYDEIIEILLEEYITELKNKGYSERLAVMTAEKMAIEEARYLLSNAVETKLILSLNGRSLLHIISKRTCFRAQDEIRELAWKLREEALKVSPVIFKKSGPACYTNGSCPEGKLCCGKSEEVKKKCG